MRVRTVYVSGNLIVKEDSVPLRIMDRLQKKFPEISFRELDPTENMPEEKTLNIIDTVIGIEDVRVIKNIDSIVTGKVYSLHDFDLGFNLKLMKKAGKIKNVHIIGVPASMNDDTALEGVSRAIREMR
jgi:Ni,Fe-hydrogenase maturation factor